MLFSICGQRHVYLERLPFTFSPLRQPCAKAFREALRRHAKAGLDLAHTHRQSIVEFGGVGKISHTELIEPFQRARATLPANHYIHVEFLRVHAETISPRIGRAELSAIHKIS